MNDEELDDIALLVGAHVGVLQVLIELTNADISNVTEQHFQELREAIRFIGLDDEKLLYEDSLFLAIQKVSASYVAIEIPTQMQKGTGA